jgi:hypothetical protein
MPATSTYTAIGKVTLSSNVTTISFTNIPQIYTDLVLVQNAIIASGAYSTGIQFNGDIISTSTNYNSIGALQNSATNVNSNTNNNQPYTYDGLTGASRSIAVWQIMDYANNKTWKSVLCRGGFQSSQLRSTVSTWKNTKSINSINIVTEYAPSSPFLSTSTWSLYGIGAKQIKAIGGDIIVSDGTYWYHAFTKSGTFTPLSALTCDYLVVAGGGGSGQGAGASGGGGAGGLRSTVTATGGGGSLETALSLSANTAYTVTIGAGGAGGAPTGVNGSNSTFATITSTGGGRSGGANPNQNGASGGSGGGGGEQIGTYGTGGSGTTNQGYAGGAAGSATYRMGGGGGAGAVGAAGGSGTGNGGVGALISALAEPTGTGMNGGYYAGGGGGAAGSSAGVGGFGGGGMGGTNVMGSEGIANTGGGGGGSYVAIGTSGGSGLVIVRYAV